MNKSVVPINPTVVTVKQDYNQMAHQINRSKTMPGFLYYNVRHFLNLGWQGQ
jgi:hypothetical protein